MVVGGSNSTETLTMGKEDAREEDARMEDVEEGEISSDSASVEEISKDDFTNKEVSKENKTTNNNSNNINSNNRVWTMTDLYKYQMKRGYVSGLYNLAWAQAVQNKPLNDIFVEVNSSATDSKEVIDVEEGELEEGEIDLDATNVVVDSDDVVEKKVKAILDELESFDFGQAHKSFGDCCRKLECVVGRVRDVVEKCSGDRMDGVVQLLLSAIRNLNSVFGSMNEELKEQNKQVYSRLLSIVNTNDPPFLNKDQIKEIEAVTASVESSKVSTSVTDGEKQNETSVYDGVDSIKNDALPRNAASESPMGNVVSPGADYFSHGNPNTSVEVPKPGINFKSRVGLLPLLDLHKDHDADSLPSPTRETAPQLPLHKPMMVGDGITNPGIFVPKLLPIAEAPKVHPYETDALKAVSSYQQKFGRNSFFMANRLPSPTPSEESGGDGDGDTGGEVSSSLNASNVRTSNPPNLGQQVIAPPHIESSNRPFGITARTIAPPSTVSVPTVKSMAKSRDPRLRFLNSDANSVNNMPKVDPVGAISGSRKQKIIEDPIVNGSFKRQKNATGNPGIVRDVKNMIGSGGWLDDSDVIGPQSINRNNSESDPRRLVNGSNHPNTTYRNGQVPVTGSSISTGGEQAAVVGNILPSLPDLLKDIAVNPTMLITLLKMGQQQKLASEAQQKLAEPPKTTTNVSMSNSALGAVSTVNNTLRSSSILSRPPEILHAPIQTATVAQQKLPDLPKTMTNVSMSNSMPGTVLGVNNTSQSPSILSRPPGMLHTPLQTATKAQQKLADPPKTLTGISMSNSLLGAVPAVNNTPQSSSMLSRAPGMIHVPLQTATPASQDESGKIRMKPRDPRRVLHNNSLQRAGSTSSEQFKSNVVPTLTPKGANDNQIVLKQEGQAEMKTAPSQSAAPDISSQFTKSLMNIADIVSVSQTPATSSVGCHITASQPVENKSVRVDSKPLILSSDHQAATVSISEGGARSQNTWGDVEHLFEGYDDHQKAAIQKERARRLDEQKKMFAARKLCLVLDLDHTLLNSAKFVEVDPMHDEILRKKEEQDREKPYRHLFRFPHMAMWTKLRPGIWNFLEKASKLYELHLYTMGNKLYATEMAKVLDPKGVLFNGRVISRGDDGEYFDGDERAPKSKDLEGVLGMESGVVIIDDSVRVWPHNKLNLIVVERYIYFPCSRRQFGLPGPSLLEIDHDERPEDGTLASSLAVIEKIHQTFFNHQSLDEADVRNILASEQRKILAGCRIVFSRVFPVGEANPHLHPLWQTAEQFGAVCTNQIDERVTHVVANSLGTDKVNWALSNGKFVVYPGWVEASALLYQRANEQDFAIKS